MANCNYKVILKDIQNKYRFKIFAMGSYNDTEIKEDINKLVGLFPKVTGEGSSLSLNNTVNYNMNLDLKGNTSQDGTPTPSSPIPVNVVSGDNVLNIVGKNLLNTTLMVEYTPTGTGWYSLDGISAFYSSTQIAKSNIYYDLKANTTYAFSVHSYKNINMGTASPIQLVNSAGSQTICVLDVANTFQAKTFTPTNDVRVYPRINISSANTVTQCIVQLEIGNQATTYTPYTSQIYDVNLGTVELCKIGTYQDYIYKDGSNWFLHKEIGKSVFTGASSESWNRELPGNNIVNHYIKINEAVNNQQIPIFNNMALYNNTISGDDNNHKCYISGSNNLNFRADEIATTNDLRTLLGTTNMVVYYILKNETDTEITDTNILTQLEALKGAMSYEGQTNISQVNNDEAFIISASAIYDLNNLVTRVEVLESEV